MDTVKKGFFILKQIPAQQHEDLSFSDIVRTQRSPKGQHPFALRLLINMGYLIFDKDIQS